jgi:hypothetical protein
MSGPGGRFIHRLALALGKSLTEVRGWPAAELEEWRIFATFEPLPDPYWIGAQIACVIANVHRTKGKAFGVEDFIPRPRPARRAMTAGQLLAAMRMALGPQSEGGDSSHPGR